MSTRKDIIRAVKTLLGTIPNVTVEITEHIPDPSGQNVLAINFPDTTTRYIQLVWAPNESSNYEQKSTPIQKWDSELECWCFTKVASASDQTRVEAADDFFYDEVIPKINSDSRLTTTDPSLSGSVLWIHVEQRNVVHLVANDKPYGGRKGSIKVEWCGE